MKKELLPQFQAKITDGRLLFIFWLLFQAILPAAGQTGDRAEPAAENVFSAPGEINKLSVADRFRRENLRNFSSRFEKNPIFEASSPENETGRFTPIGGEKAKLPEPDGKSSETKAGKSESDAATQTETRTKFHWKPALIQSGIFLGIQHSYRMTQERTRRELGGAFFRDWGKSIKGLSGWRDSDGFFINYIAHPLQGGVTGRIFVNNSDAANSADFGINRFYLKSRLKAFVWSTVWSTQFELGPFSEASFGNVGIRKKRGRSTMAYVDLVITPTLGTGVLMAEDAIDKYVLRNWLERKNGGRLSPKLKILRCALTPTMCFANILRGKAPWKRDFR